MFAGIFSCTPSFSPEINKVYLILTFTSAIIECVRLETNQMLCINLMVYDGFIISSGNFLIWKGSDMQSKQNKVTHYANAYIRCFNM